jgi:MFS family permease
MGYLPDFGVLIHEPGIIAIQGLGGGGILPLTQIILSDLVPLRERGMFSGLLGMCVRLFRSTYYPEFTSNILDPGRLQAGWVR